MAGKRHAAFKLNAEDPDSILSEDYLMKHLVIKGTVNSVVDQILQLREEVGDFGEIVYAGMDWVDPYLAKRSMELMATQVMPRVNKAIEQAQTNKKVA